MAVTHQGVFVQSPMTTPMSFVNADGTSKKTLYTAGSNGSKVVRINATTTDTSNNTVQLWLTRSSTSYLIGTAVVTTLAGTNGTQATQDLIPSSLITLPTDNDGQRYLFVQSGDTLQASVTVAVTAAKELDIVTIASDF